MKCFPGLFALVALLASAHLASAQQVRIEKIDLKTTNGISVLGELRIPVVATESSTDSKKPLVLVFPNAGGLEGTGPQYIRELNKLGIATAEMNPLMEMDVLKWIGMALGATRFAVENHGIDPKRVGMMGFSQGAMASLVASTEHWMKRLTRGGPFRFKAIASLYAPCSVMSDFHSADFMNWKTARADPSGEKNSYKGMFDQLSSPVLMLVGENDDYEDVPTECPKLYSTMTANPFNKVTFTIYPGAGHGWDTIKNREYDHGISRKSARIRHYRDPKSFELGLKAVTDFFVRELQTP